MAINSPPRMDTLASDDANPGGALDDVVVEARDRFRRCSKWEHTARKAFLDDLKFAEGDAYNGYQWPNEIRRSRDIDERPCLTNNIVRQHNLNIINDAKQNKPRIKIRASGGPATSEAASVWNSIMRRIEYKSNAQVAYDHATSFQVRAGYGVLRVETRYVAPDSFDQEAWVTVVKDPLTVYFDPDAKEVDKSDAKFAFVFEDLHEDEFKKKYPEYADLATANTIDDADGWIKEDYIRVCEYFRVVEHKDMLYAVVDAAQPGVYRIYKASDFAGAPEALEAIKAQAVNKRETKIPKVEWKFLIGLKVVESNVWPGKYIPLVPVIGEETIIEGVMDRKGHTRAMLDPQRIYNYWSSTAVEYGALQTKTPWAAPVEAIEGYETYWNTANRINHSVLPFRSLDDAGQKIEPPKRIEPPVALPVAITGMQLSQNELMSVSGQFADKMGDQSNERSAKAITERQRQGDNATYHFIDNLAIAIRHVGRILLDLVPKIYDTRRVMQILAEDGTSYELIIDPKAVQAHQQKVAETGQVVQRILNPNLGEYEVEADVGPDYGTKRQETFNALALILTQAPQLTQIIGDILLASSDFDKAEEAAARLRRMVPPQALGQGPSISEQQLMAQVQNLTKLLQSAMEELAGEKLRMKGKEEQRDIDVYNAITQRLKIFIDPKIAMGEDVEPAEVQRVVREAISEALNVDPMRAIVAANAPALAGAQGQLPLNGGAMQTPETPPIPGARRGRDGHWYIRDYAKSGAYALVS
jgi:hypothetical protein